ncbi:putative cyclin-dependent kinase 1 [Rhypophila decipiens]|uniref:Cyclin-dependent kinase 1 n=1 Tax=Rhypophila decipiens TaxID=261697 RepID=A0AAN6Y6K1_9PEZI|nr:putative cyclin-dependent kinase 1 [Rhypophila decipiens]
MATTRQMLKALRRLSIENTHDKRPFIPYHGLVETFSRATVLELLKGEKEIPFTRRDEIADAVLNDSLRLLAILVDIDELPALVRFLELDHFSAGDYDRKLPASKQDMLKIFGHDEDGAKTADLFFSTQWTYLTPTVTKDRSFRMLDPHTILPFDTIEAVPLASRGSFSQVHLVQLYMPPDTEPGPRTKLVWKKVVPSQGPCLDEDFSREVEVLSMLRCLHHPNIVELYTAFARGNEFSLLMPVAECDLGKFLNGITGPIRGLSTADEIRSALWGLASGLRAVHDYFADDFDERRIGCHYDIKPPNILCRKGRLILSDFGLSRLREEADGSRTPFQDVNGAYVAPECICSGEKQDIGRASDVWSLACVLCEVIAFLLGGAERVAEFRKDRKISYGNHREWNGFHNGEIVNPVAKRLLEGLRSGSGPSQPEHWVALAAAVRSGLEMEPAQRADAKGLTWALLRMTLRTAYARIRVPSSNGPFDLYVEIQRVVTWAEETGLAQEKHDPSSAPLYSSHGEGAAIERILDRTVLEIQDIRKRFEQGVSRATNHCYCLRKLVNQLWDMHAPLKQNLQSRLEEKVLGSPFSLSPYSLETIRNDTGHQRLAVLIVAKAITEKLSGANSGSTPREDRLLSPEAIALPGQDLHWHKLSTYKPTGQRVLIEKTEYDTEWATQEDRLIERIERISQLRGEMPVSSSSSSSSQQRLVLPMLQSLGYTHDASNCEFGIIYAFPPGCAETDRPPISLHTAITETGKSRTLHPSLTERFMLASTLARHVLDLHTIGWLHKSLCSYNIIFFSDDSNSDSKSSRRSKLRLTRPWFIGFDLARFNSYTAFSTGPTLGTTQIKDYQHPAYLRAVNLHNFDRVTTTTNKTPNLVAAAPERYRQEFDYYSVGLVLLEIAFWKPLAGILAKLPRKKQDSVPTAEEVRRELLRSHMSLVASYMGDRYAQVVRDCLGFYEDISVKVMKDDPGFVRGEFRRLVVDELARLCIV